MGLRMPLPLCTCLGQGAAAGWGREGEAQRFPAGQGKLRDPCHPSRERGEHPLHTTGQWLLLPGTPDTAGMPKCLLPLEHAAAQTAPLTGWVGSQARAPACGTRTKGRGAQVRTGNTKQRSDKWWEGIGQGCQGWEGSGVLENVLSLAGAQKRSEMVFVRSTEPSTLILLQPSRKRARFQPVWRQELSQNGEQGQHSGKLR